jgi:hypothetical protein
MIAMRNGRANHCWRRGRENYYSLRLENLYEVQCWLSQFEHL